MIKDTYSIFVSEWALDIPAPAASDRAAEGASIALPRPQTDAGKPLMQSLKDRRSWREFSRDELPAQVLSDLLWAACGVNRPETTGRTSPSAENWQEIDVYVGTREGLFVYDATNHALIRRLTKDIRSLTGLQSFVMDAPVELVYVADFSRAEGATDEERRLYCVADTGFIAQNVYLFCASEGLATVVRGAVDRAPLAKAMGLGRHQRIILAQTIGYPAKTR